MTTGTRIDPGDREFRRWAADQLGTSPLSPVTLARTAFCNLLRDADFVPPVEWHSAYKVLAVDPNLAAAPVFGEPNIVRDVQDRLRVEIDEFTAEYFDLDPDQRRNRWGELLVRSASFRSLANWLDALAPGLDIRRDMTLNGPPQLFSLFEAVLRNFILRPTEAAWQRQRFNEECQPEIGAYQYAAQQMQKRYPALAALAPDLVTQLATWSKAQRDREARRKKLRSSLAQSPSYSAAGAAEKKSANAGSRYWVVIAIIVGANVLRLIFSSDSKPKPQFNSPPPNFHITPYYPPQKNDSQSPLSRYSDDNGPNPQNVRFGEEALRRYRYLKEQQDKAEQYRKSLEPNRPQSQTPLGPEMQKIMREAQDLIEKNKRQRPAINPERPDNSPFDIPDDELLPQRAKSKPDGD